MDYYINLIARSCPIMTSISMPNLKNNFTAEKLIPQFSGIRVKPSRSPASCPLIQIFSSLLPPPFPAVLISLTLFHSCLISVLFSFFLYSFSFSTFPLLFTKLIWMYRIYWNTLNANRAYIACVFHCNVYACVYCVRATDMSLISGMKLLVH